MYITKEGKLITSSLINIRRRSRNYKIRLNSHGIKSPDRELSWFSFWFAQMLWSGDIAHMNMDYVSRITQGKNTGSFIKKYIPIFTRGTSQLNQNYFRVLIFPHFLNFFNYFVTDMNGFNIFSVVLKTPFLLDNITVNLPHGDKVVLVHVAP